MAAKFSTANARKTRDSEPKMSEQVYQWGGRTSTCQGEDVRCGRYRLLCKPCGWDREVFPVALSPGSMNASTVAVSES